MIYEFGDLVLCRKRFSRKVDYGPGYRLYFAQIGSLVISLPVAAAYLNAVLEDGDFEHILLALKHVAEARRAVATLSSQIDTTWDTCDRMIAKGDMPGFPLIANLLNSLGLKLTVTVREDQAA